MFALARLRQRACAPSEIEASRAGGTTRVPDWTKVEGSDWERCDALRHCSLFVSGRGCPVSNPDQYRHHALDCLRLANETSDPGAKAVPLDMAQSWVRLADHAQKNLRTDLIYETPPPASADDHSPKPSPR